MPTPSIYLDYPATTPCDPRVVEAMLPYFSALAANPHNRQHAAGRAAAAAIEQARSQVAALIGARPAQIIFTSGATEANNLALHGTARARRTRGRHLVTVATEHASVLEPLRALERDGFELTILPVDAAGLVDPDRLAAALRPDTILVSVMAVNNEIGAIQPSGEIGALCRARGIPFHCDAAQAAGRLPLDVGTLDIDLLSLSAHKLYGPPGIGALYLRAGDPVSLQQGGGQERGLRPGTLPTPLCVGFGRAAVLARMERADERIRLGLLGDRLWHGLRRQVPGIRRNGDPAHCVAGLLSISFPGVDATDLMEDLPDLALSSGAACSAANGLPSSVLSAIGLDAALAQSTLRIGLGRFTGEAEIDRAIQLIGDAVSS